MTAVVPASGASSPDPSFYSYIGSVPLANLAPGSVLKTRSLSYTLEGVPLPLRVTQLLYRTTDLRGRPSVNVTSVLKTPVRARTSRVVAYGSFYDSLNPHDSPSYAIAGGTTLGGLPVHMETALIAPLLLAGYSVILADTEGENADFAAGPEYGRTTLDSIRAVSNSPATGVDPVARVGLFGYSGGAIATSWAAALAPSYAPDVNRRLVGAAEGGLLVAPAHNLNYIQGSRVWAGVLVMGIIGISRAAHIDLTPCLNDYGISLFRKLSGASIVTVLAAHPGLTWAKIAKPQYPRPEIIPAYVRAVNRLNLGSRPTPTVPMFIGQGANGALEGTSGSKRGIGPGDGVMITGDARTLARKYCAAGTRVSYREYAHTSHFTTLPLWLPDAYGWLLARFGGTKAPSSCGRIPVGNALTPIAAPGS